MKSEWKVFHDSLCVIWKRFIISPLCEEITITRPVKNKLFRTKSVHSQLKLLLDVFKNTCEGGDF